MVLFAGYIGVGESILFLSANNFIDPNNPSSYSNLWNFASIALFIALVLWVLFVFSPSTKKTKINNMLDIKKIDVGQAFRNPIV